MKYSVVLLTFFLIFQTVFAQTPEPDYDPLTIAALRERRYGEGAIQIEEIMAQQRDFTRYLISYPSDGLTIYGFINIPTGEGPFPVIIAIHGYVDPLVYNTLAYTTRYADALTRAGYVVIHPNLRDYWPSDIDNTDGMFRVGYAVDILNLVALLKSNKEQIPQANVERIGLWGHSMGGGISLRVLTVTQQVNAAVLYGSMSGNELKNYTQILEWSGGNFGERELNTPPEKLVHISPIYYLDGITTPLSIHHGLEDESVPYAWSVELCDELFVLQKEFECHFYENQRHTFQGEGDALFMERIIGFYDRYLK